MSELTAIDNSIISIGNSLVKVVPSTPVDPYNPLDLPPFTIRVKFKSGYIPEPKNTTWDSKTLVDPTENVWDITRNSTNWETLLGWDNNVLEVLGANSTGVIHFSGMFYECKNLSRLPLFDTRSCHGTYLMFLYCTSLTTVPLFDTSTCVDMYAMFEYCTSLTTVPLFDTRSCKKMNNMFLGCVNVQSGALALYQQASTQTTPPTQYSDCFTDCGSNTTTGAAELAQIPTSWGGTRAQVINYIEETLR